MKQKNYNFKIETDSTWKWADAVKRKEVWRADEFVRAKSKEEALAAEFLLGKPQGLTYTITVKRDDEFFTYYRHSQPCLGSLVKYCDVHGPDFSMNPYFPRDIYVAFPEGEIVFIGMYSQGIKEKLKNPYYQFIFSEESPWIGAFNNKDSIIFKDNYFLLTNMEACPTTFYSLMRLGNIMYGQPKAGWNPKADILLSKYSQADPRRLAGQKPINTSGGTWSQSFGYTRPHCEHIFHTSLPSELKDFNKYPNNTYPPVPKFSNEYFLAQMKEKFGTDIANAGPNPDKKIQDALVVSWDFFREESKKLNK